MSGVITEAVPRWAVVTGAAGGIGHALSRVFAEDGYRIIATDHVPQPASLLCDHYLQVDLARTVTDEDYAASQFRKISAWLNGNGLHALINNAAIQILGGACDLSRNDWQHTLNVNLIAPFFWIQALLPHLEAVQGSIVNVSSIHARLTKRNFVAYATSKAALSGMTRAMAVDLGPKVRVNAIEPAAIETPMLKAGLHSDPAIYSKLAQCHPQMRLGQPDEVARLALAISSGHMKFLSGTCIGLDGGIASRLHDPE